jgi:hypothetical protein
VVALLFGAKTPSLMGKPSGRGFDCELDDAEFQNALNQLALGKRPVSTVKNDCWNVLDRLEGQLKERFPGQPKFVASFFMPADISSSKDEEPDEEAVAPAASGDPGAAAP